MVELSRSVKCEVCDEQLSKYTCPRCETRTCSLACVKQHKKDADCTGVRNKSAYVSLENYTDLKLLSDYRMLEDAARVTERCKRDLLLKRRRSRSLIWLTKEAHKRRIRFRSLPFNMVRRRQNSSIFNFKSKHIHWDITWIFQQSGISHTQKRTSEELTIMEALQKLLDPSIADPILLYKLKKYRNVDLKTLGFFMKAEMQKNVCYYSLCLDQSLLDNLCGKVVLEHPVIHVVFPGQKSDYPLIDTDNISKVTCDEIKSKDVSSTTIHDATNTESKNVSPIMEDKKVLSSKTDGVPMDQNNSADYEVCPENSEITCESEDVSLSIIKDANNTESENIPSLVKDKKVFGSKTAGQPMDQDTDTDYGGSASLKLKSTEECSIADNTITSGNSLSPVLNTDSK